MSVVDHPKRPAKNQWLGQPLDIQLCNTMFTGINSLWLKARVVNGRASGSLSINESMRLGKMPS